jgi:predicted HicB family RNase H-like nuclease
METKKMIIEIAEELHRQLKIVSATQGVSMRQLIIEAIEEIIKINK